MTFLLLLACSAYGPGEHEDTYGHSRDLLVNCWLEDTEAGQPSGRTRFDDKGYLAEVRLSDGELYSSIHTELDELERPVRVTTTRQEGEGETSVRVEELSYEGESWRLQRHLAHRDGELLWTEDYTWSEDSYVIRDEDCELEVELGEGLRPVSERASCDGEEVYTGDIVWEEDRRVAETFTLNFDDEVWSLESQYDYDDEGRLAESRFEFYVDGALDGPPSIVESSWDCPGMED